MMAIFCYYYYQNPLVFGFLVQIRALVTETSKGLPNFNMKEITKWILVLEVKMAYLQIFRPREKNINFKYSNLTIYSKYFLVWICSNPPVNSARYRWLHLKNLLQISAFWCHLYPGKIDRKARYLSHFS